MDCELQFNLCVCYHFLVYHYCTTGHWLHAFLSHGCVQRTNSLLARSGISPVHPFWTPCVSLELHFRRLQSHQGVDFLFRAFFGLLKTVVGSLNKGGSAIRLRASQKHHSRKWLMSIATLLWEHSFLWLTSCRTPICVSKAIRKQHSSLLHTHPQRNSILCGCFCMWIASPCDIFWESATISIFTFNAPTATIRNLALQYPVFRIYACWKYFIIGNDMSLDSLCDEMSLTPTQCISIGFIPCVPVLLMNPLLFSF